MGEEKRVLSALRPAQLLSPSALCILAFYTSFFFSWFFALLARSLHFNTISVFLFSALWFFALLARSLRFNTM
jgi:hypothetical protein